MGSITSSEYKIKEKIIDDDYIITVSNPVTDLIVSINLTANYNASYMGMDTIFYDQTCKVQLRHLYNGSSPKGTARSILCKMIKHYIDNGTLKITDDISLLADGSVNGSFIHLIGMYMRMGFSILATKNIYSNLFEDIQAGNEPRLLSDGEDPTVFMGTSLYTLTNWCDYYYGVETFELRS